MTLEPCRMITERHTPLFGQGQTTWSYSLCQEPGLRQRVSDGVRAEKLPVCRAHVSWLREEGDAPSFRIESASPSEPVIEPLWMIRDAYRGIGGPPPSR